MVDRYLLPIPKTKNFRMYLRYRNKPLWALPYMIAVGCIAFQVNRYLALRSVVSKPGGYYMDWASKDAPAKVRYFSSEK